MMYDLAVLITAKHGTKRNAGLPRQCSGIIMTLDAKTEEEARKNTSAIVRQWAANAGVIIDVLTITNISPP